MQKWLMLLAFGLSVAVATHARAELDEGAKLVARELMAKGRAQRDAKDFQGALRSFSKAHAIMHVPTTLLEAARAHGDVGLLLEGLTLLHELPQMPAKPGEPVPFAKARADAVALAADLAARVPQLSIDLSGSPDRATTLLWIDGFPRPDCVRGCPLDPGQHQVIARARRAQAEQQIQLAERQSRRLALVFSLDTSADVGSAGAWAAAPTTSPPPRDQAPRRPRVSTLTWALSGVALAGLGTGTALGLSAVSRRDELRRECAPSCAQSDVDDVRRRAIFANVSLGVGLAAAALAATSYIAWRGNF